MFKICFQGVGRRLFRVFTFVCLMILLCSGIYASVSIFTPTDPTVWTNPHWERGSSRKLRVIFNLTSGPFKLYSVDAYFRYNQNANGDGSAVFNTPASFDYNYVNNLSQGLFDPAWKTGTPGVMGFTFAKTGSDLGWTLSSGDNPVYDVTFNVTSDAVLGDTLFDWYVASGNTYCHFVNSYSVDVTGTPNTLTVNIENSAAPTGFLGLQPGGVNNPSTPNGNTLVLTWDNTNVRDTTPFTTFPTLNRQDVRYNIYRSTSTPFTPSTQNRVATNISGTTWTDGNNSGVPTTGLNDGTIYYYIVRAYDNCNPPNIDQNTSVVSGVPRDTTPPDNVSNFGASAVHRGINLSWGNPTDPDFDSVLIVRSAEAAPTFVPQKGTAYNVDDEVVPGEIVVYNNNGQSFNDTDLSNNTTYYYKAFTYDVSNDAQEGLNYSSGASASARPGVAPGAVADFHTSVMDQLINLYWTNPNPSPDCFGGTKILMKTGGYPSGPDDGTATLLTNESWSMAGKNSSRSMTITQYGGGDLVNGSTYYFRAYSYNFNTTSDPDSRPLYSIAQTTGAPIEDLTAPDSVQYFYWTSSAGKVQLHWTNPSQSYPDFGSVLIVRTTTTEFTFVPQRNTAYSLHQEVPTIGSGYFVVYVSNESSCIDDYNITNGTTYYYRAWARDYPRYNCAAYDETAATPGGITAIFSGPTTVKQGWNLIASGQPVSMSFGSSNISQYNHAGTQSTADLIYQLIPGSTDFYMAYLSEEASGYEWIDVNTGQPPTWEMEPDRGFFYRNRHEQFDWGTRGQ